MSNWKKEFQAEVKRLLLEKGMPVDYREQWWDDDIPPVPNVYGWRDWHAYQHCTGKWYHGDDRNITPCGYVVPDQVTITEESFSEFQGTFADNKEVLGINMSPVACQCGKYTGLTLRHEGSLGDLMRDILEVE